MSREFSVDRRGFLKGMGAGIAASLVPQHMLRLVDASPKTIKKVTSIEDGALALIELIREVSRLQAETWQKVPALALEADGRSGFVGRYKLAYEDKLWSLNAGMGVSTCVDLNDGELLLGYARNERIRSAPNEEVLYLALNMDQIDATGIVESLKTAAREDHWGYKTGDGRWIQSFDPIKQEEWRNSLRKKYKLSKPDLK